MSVALFQSHAGELLLEKMPKEPVPRPATTQNYAARRPARFERSLAGLANRASDEVGCRAKQIVDARAVLPCELKPLLDEFIRRTWPLKTPRMPSQNMWMAEPSLKQGLDSAPLYPILAAGVECFLPCRDVPN